MPSLAAVILVGGKANRLQGQNKCDLKIGPKSCLQWTLDLFKSHVDKIALSVGQEDRYNHAIDYEIIFDWPSGLDAQGVALAILGSLAWAKDAGYSAIITTPVDTPFLPENYAALLKRKNDGSKPTVCKTSEGLHGLHAIWPVSCFESIKRAVIDDGILKISKLHKRLHSTEVTFTDQTQTLFLNINDEEVLRNARQRFPG